MPHRIHLKGPWEYEWRDRPCPPTGEGLPAVSSAPDGPASRLRRLPVHRGSDRINAGTTNAPAGRVKMPADWESLFGRQAGRVVFRRRFHRPTNLDPNERVLLVFEGVGGIARVELNGQALGTATDRETRTAFEITELLQPGNEISVDIEFDPVTSPSRRGGLWGPVAIEIFVVRDTASGQD